MLESEVLVTVSACNGISMGNDLKVADHSLCVVSQVGTACKRQGEQETYEARPASGVAHAFIAGLVSWPGPCVVSMRAVLAFTRQ